MSDNFYGGGSGSSKNEAMGRSFKAVISEFIWKIGGLASKEMRGGYHQTTMVPMGGAMLSLKVWVPDSREELCNSIDFLYRLMQPEIVRYTPKKKECKHVAETRNILVKIKSLNNSFISSTEKKDSSVMHVEAYQGSDREKAEVFRHAQVELYKELFLILSDFWCEMDRFSDEGGIIDDLSRIETPVEPESEEAMSHAKEPEPPKKKDDGIIKET